MKKNVLSILLCVLVLIPSFAVCAATYTDVDGHWAESSIERWADEEIINGYSDNTYKPDSYITRAEFATMVVNLLGTSEMGDLNKFKDVSKDAWYYEAISKAVSLGIIEGYSDNTLRPEGKITRQEAMTIINRVLKLEPTSEKIEGFSDSDKVANWAKEAMAAFIENGYVEGYGDGSVRPEGLITRAESAKILNKSIAKVIKEPGEYDLKDVEGCVIVRAKDVTIKNLKTTANLCVTTSSAKDTLELENSKVNETIVIEKEKESEKPSGGSSSTSNKSTCTITINTVSGEASDIYTVSRSKTVKDGTYLTVILDGKEIVSKTKLTSASFKDTMVKIFNSLDVKKAIYTLSQEKYNGLTIVRRWGMNTIDAMDEEKNGVKDIAIGSAILGDGPVLVSKVYDALINATEIDVTDEFIRANAIEVIDTTFSDYAEGISFLNQI